MAIGGDHPQEPDIKHARIVLDIQRSLDESRSVDTAMVACLPEPWKDIAQKLVSEEGPGPPSTTLEQLIDDNPYCNRLKTALDVAKSELETLDDAAISRCNGKSTVDCPKVGHTLADVPEIVQGTKWLWPSWVPLGYVTLVAGQPGIGKSIFVLQSLVAPVLEPDQFSFPDHSKCDIDSRARIAVWFDTECAQPMLVERARHLELDLARIRTPVNPNRPNDMLAQITLDDEMHRQALVELIRESNAPLLVVDAMLGAHQGNEAKSRDVSRVLTWLSELARDESIAVVVVDHLRKTREGEDSNIVTIERIRDSGAKAQYSRSVIALDTPRLSREQDVRIRVIKANLCRPPEPCGMQIVDPGVAEWLVEAPEPLGRLTRGAEAMDFLRPLLASGPRAVQEIKKLAEADGFAWKTIERAKKPLHVEATRQSGVWWWNLPGPATQGDSSPTVEV
jgi:putative DNA primase/helicase